MIIIKRPIVTEKSMKLAQSNLYTFEVNNNAYKDQIVKAVTERFSVKVIGVKIINVKGRVKQQRVVRRRYVTKDYKKALIQVKKGDKIALFETPKEEDVVVTTAEGEPIKLKEKKDLLGRTKVKVETTGGVGAAPTTQRKVITGK